MLSTFKMNRFILTFVSISALICQSYADSGSAEHGVGPGAKTPNCTCGWTNKNQQRIVNGREALVNEFPFVVGIRLEYSSFIFCGGTIITRYHVLTAAHCPEKYSSEPLAVIVGEHNAFEYKNKPKSAKVINVTQVIMHEKYNVTGTGYLEYDIALFVLQERIQFNKEVGPACFPPPQKINVEGERVKVMGWGKLYPNASLPSFVLNKVNLNVISLKKCKETFPGINMKQSTPLCTYRENKDACQGDSGGPVVWLDPQTNRFTIIGFVSFGKNCALKDTPGVNIDAQSFRNWILYKIAETVPNATTCQRV